MTSSNNTPDLLLYHKFFMFLRNISKTGMYIPVKCDIIINVKETIKKGKNKDATKRS